MVASRESTVRGCPFSNSPTSGAANRSGATPEQALLAGLGRAVRAIAAA